LFFGRSPVLLIKVFDLRIAHEGIGNSGIFNQLGHTLAAVVFNDGSDDSIALGFPNGAGIGG
jgi:hypothetical protein